MKQKPFSLSCREHECNAWSHSGHFVSMRTQTTKGRLFKKKNRKSFAFNVVMEHPNVNISYRFCLPYDIICVCVCVCVCLQLLFYGLYHSASYLIFQFMIAPHPVCLWLSLFKLLVPTSIPLMLFTVIHFILLRTSHIFLYKYFV